MVVETVGVGQSETDVEELCDTTAVVVQPASGDTLQFLKAGIMEVPDVLVVTKADLGDVALRAQRDLRAALRSLGVRGHPGRERLVRCRRRAASTSSWRRWTSTAASLDLAATRLRDPPPGRAGRLHGRARRAAR